MWSFPRSETLCLLGYMKQKKEGSINIMNNLIIMVQKLCKSSFGTLYALVWDSSVSQTVKLKTTSS